MVGVRVVEILQEIRLVHADGAAGAGGCFAAPEDTPGALSLGHLQGVAGRGVSVIIWTAGEEAVGIELDASVLAADVADAAGGLEDT